MPTDTKDTLLSQRVTSGTYGSIAELNKRVDEVQASLEATANSYRDFSEVLTRDLDKLADDVVDDLKTLKTEVEHLYHHKAEASKVSEAFGKLKEETKDFVRTQFLEYLQEAEKSKYKNLAEHNALTTNALEAAKASISASNGMSKRLRELERAYKFLLYCFTGFVLINVLLALYAFHLI